ncbi:hypothetical protein ACFL4T_09315 [candidate division KSB1 bacterium]
MEEEFKDFISFFDNKTSENNDNDTSPSEDAGDTEGIEQIDPNVSEVIEENGITLKINREENAIKSIDVICQCGKKARIDIEYEE